MFVFILPFIAEGVASDWQQAVTVLERTLKSVLANPERKVRAIVICQDRPHLNLKDDRYIFLTSHHPKPNKTQVMAKHADKGAKIVAGFDAAREMATEYAMVVDADDLVSNRLVSYVYQKPQFDAFCMKMGYEWREGSNYFIRRHRFNQVCGSAFVWRFNARVFPSWVGKNFTKRVADQGHNLVEEAMDKEGLMVNKIYSPKVVYVTGHANHMYGEYHNIPWKRYFREKLLAPLRNRRLTPDLRDEFGLTNELAMKRAWL